MPSMKRLTVMAAFSNFYGHENHKNSTITFSILPSNRTTTNTSTSTSPSTSTPTEAAISYFGAKSAYNQNDISSSPQIGGLGLLHQQNLRSGTINGGLGLSGGVGVGVGVGAFGGYSAGSWSGGSPVMGGGGGITNSGNMDKSNSINGNVNILLGGAMLSLVTTVLCVVCYCCHRNIKKRTEAAYRQRWLENDTNTNMEVYTVEQCYDPSGLFMESSEGLPLPSALSHEPPPSYDAVMVAAMQEANHQPIRISPPPDYRSMNDVSGSLRNTNENPKSITFRGNNSNLRSKKVFSAQSCCSLQRAEAENLLELGVAAAAATSRRFGASALGMKSLPYAAHNLAEGRFMNHNPYNQGCPLCGKFRYDDSMSLSSDSGLDQVVVTVDVNNENANGNTNTQQVGVGVGVNSETCYCTSTSILDDSNNNVDGRRSSMHHATIDDRRRILTQQLMASSHLNFENTINNNDNVGDNTPTISDNDATLPGTTSSLSLPPPPTIVSSQTTTITPIEEASTSENHRRHTINSIDDDDDDAMLQLDSINDNGIIRLDMSKIIDKTGLPTYEAALKLESSGYV